MAAQTILVVEDEPAIRESVAYSLRRDGFEVREAGTLADAALLSEGVTLITLDLMLPDGSGLDFLRDLRERSRVPVIVLTSRDDETDRVVGLELGADDYVVKPFSPRELVARVRAVLRRTALTPEQAAVAAELAGGLKLNADARRVHVNATELELSRTEFDLLRVLASVPGRVFTRQQLLSEVWGEVQVSDRTIDTHIKTLRKKVEQAGGDPLLVETVRGIGYRLREADE